MDLMLPLPAVAIVVLLAYIAGSRQNNQKPIKLYVHPTGKEDYEQSGPGCRYWLTLFGLAVLLGFFAVAVLR